MTLDKILSYSSSFGTFISAIAALYAIWLTIFQRRLSYKPVLIVTDIQIISDTKDGSVFSVDCLVDRNEIKAKINNIGLGAATSLKYRWEYDHNKQIEEYQRGYINKHGKRDDSCIVKESYGFVNFQSDKNVMSFSALEKNKDIDFLLPYNSKKEDTELFVPYPALIIMSNILFTHFSKLNSENKKIEGPKLIVEYQDLEGKITVNEWQSQMELTYITFGNPKIKSQWSIRFYPVARKWTHKGLHKIRKSYADFIGEHNINRNN